MPLLYEIEKKLMVCSIALDFSSFGTIPPSSKRTPTGQLTSAMWILPLSWWNIEVSLCELDCHFAVAAVELEDKALTVVKNIQRGGGRYLFASLLFRA